MKILYHPRCVKFLRKISSKEAKKLIKAINKLNSFPKKVTLDIKKLINTKSSYRLRSGNIRIIFEANFEKELIYINDIDFRGNIY